MGARCHLTRLNASAGLAPRQQLGIIASMSDQELDFVKESLPHDLGPYQKAAQSDTQKQFESRCPYPFLLFARSQLWDPSLLQRSQGSPGEDEDSGTMVVRYDKIGRASCRERVFPVV